MQPQKNGANSGVRTRDIRLGRTALCQLRYSRKIEGRRAIPAFDEIAERPIENTLLADTLICFRNISLFSLPENGGTDGSRTHYLSACKADAFAALEPRSH